MTNYIEYVLLKHINDIEAEQGEIKEETDRWRGRFFVWVRGERSNAASVGTCKVDKIQSRRKLHKAAESQAERQRR